MTYISSRFKKWPSPVSSPSGSSSLYLSLGLSHLAVILFLFLIHSFTKYLQCSSRGTGDADDWDSVSALVSLRG
jgi:hypothetical protein